MRWDIVYYAGVLLSALMLISAMIVDIIDRYGKK